jgi:transcriptional regulator with GAF, ATPase, and Fis domain
MNAARQWEPPAPSARYEALRRVSRTIAAHRDASELFRSLAADLHAVVHFVFLRVFLYDEERRLMRLHVSEAPGQPVEPFSEFAPEGTAVGWVYEHQEPLVILDVDEETRFPRLHGILKEYGIRSHCTFPLTTAHRRLEHLRLAVTAPTPIAKRTSVSYLWSRIRLRLPLMTPCTCMLCNRRSLSWKREINACNSCST